MTPATWVSRLSPATLSPGLKQLPTTAAFLLATVLVLLPVGPQQSNTPLFVAGILTATAASLLAFAVPWQRFAPLALLSVPLLSMLAVAFFRAGTGGAASPYNAILILPFLWVATEPGRRYAILASVLTFFVILSPVALTHTADNGLAFRALFSPLMYMIAALVINDFAHRVRQQTAAAERSAAHTKQLLADTLAAKEALATEQERLNAAHRFIQSIWNAVTEQSIIGVNLRGEVNAWNPGAAKMLGISEADALARHAHILDFIAPDADVPLPTPGPPPPHPSEAQTAQFHSLVSGVVPGSPLIVERVYCRPDHREIPVQLAITARTDSAGEHSGFIFVATDMTSAHEVARLKDQFVGLISHELRTPISSILGYLDLMRDDGLSDEQLSYLTIAERGAHRLLRLVGDLLLTAQLESGTFELQREPSDLRALAEAAVATAAPLAQRGAVTLVTDFAAECTASVDPLRITQVLDNLLSNAIKYTPEHGTVTFTLCRETPGDTLSPSSLLLRVHDTGIGIPAAELPQLFEPFFRASTALHAGVQGIGLGLPITKALVAAHGGTLSVDSDAENGTTFTVRLPSDTSAHSIGETVHPLEDRAKEKPSR